MNESVKESCWYLDVFKEKRNAFTPGKEMPVFSKNTFSHLEWKYVFVCGSTHCYSDVGNAESGNANWDQPKEVSSATA
jgi:hypothetical protein